jgi:hypothetical protein
MFKPFYSLSKTPFSKDISPNEVFPSASHAEALARLDFLRKTKGIGLFTGEAGAGKTLTLRSFVVTLNPSLFKPIYLPLASLTVMDTYRSIAMALGLMLLFARLTFFTKFNMLSLIYLKLGALLRFLFLMKCSCLEMPSFQILPCFLIFLWIRTILISSS